MNKKLRRQLRQNQSRIQRRIERENQNTKDDGRPVLRGTGAKYGIADRVRAVAAGGVALIHQLVKSVGLCEEIDARVECFKAHAPYHESDHVINIAYNLLAGGECLEHLELLRNDECYLDMLGARRIPDPTTAGDFCRRFTDDDSIDTLQEAINEARLRIWAKQPDAFFEEAFIDADGSHVDASECTAGADFGNKGFGFHPLLVTLSNTQEVLQIVNRPGNRPSHEGAAARLDAAVALALRAGFRRITLRGDTDFSQTAFLDGWDARGVRFVFGYDAMQNLRDKADSLAECAWSLLEREGYEIRTQPRSKPENVREQRVVEREFRNITLEEEHVAEFDYKPTKCKQTYRMVVVRKALRISRGQDLLFPATRYFFYITNRRDVPAREIVRMANTRCDQERIIGQQKSNVRSLRAPLDNLHSNWAYMVMATLAWNLAKWTALLLPERGRWTERRSAEKTAVLRMNFGTFVRAFMLVPTQVIRAGRQITLRMLAWNRWQASFFRALDSVRLVT